MELSLSLQAGKQGAVYAAMLAHQGWRQGCFPCGDAHCMRGCPSVGLPVTKQGKDQRPSLWRTRSRLPLGGGGGGQCGNQMLLLIFHSAH